MHFKMHKIIFFSRKKDNEKKNEKKKNKRCLPYLIVSDLLPETHLFFYLALRSSTFLLLSVTRGLQT